MSRVISLYFSLLQGICSGDRFAKDWVLRLRVRIEPKYGHGLLCGLLLDESLSS
jgi:hypothetical protein